MSISGVKSLLMQLKLVTLLSAKGMKSNLFIQSITTYLENLQDKAAGG